MKFSDIPYHQEVKSRLRQLVDDGRMPHALLLEGPSGSGKFQLARALAQYLHCRQPENGEPCGHCPSCLQHKSFNHIDTYYAFPVVKKSPRPGISVEYAPEFYEFLRDYPYMDFEKWLVALDNVNAQPAMYVDEGLEISRWLSFTAAQSKHKIVLMWLPERLREDAANKLLKMIEEPTDKSLFVIVSNNPRAILPTIYSRLQRIKVTRYSDEEVAGILEGNYGISPEHSVQIARLSDGDMNVALSLIKISKQRIAFLELFKTLMRKAFSRDVAELKDWSVEAAALGREQLMAFCEYTTVMLRENFILNLNIPELSRLSKEEYEFASRFHTYINSSNVLKFIKLFDEAKRDVAGNANAKIVCFDIAVKSIMLILLK